MITQMVEKCVSRGHPCPHPKRPKIFGISYMRVYNVRNNQILHGDQTICEEIFFGSTMHEC